MNILRLDPMNLSIRIMLALMLMLILLLMLRVLKSNIDHRLMKLWWLLQARTMVYTLTPRLSSVYVYLVILDSKRLERMDRSTSSSSCSSRLHRSGVITVKNGPLVKILR